DRGGIETPGRERDQRGARGEQQRHDQAQPTVQQNDRHAQRCATAATFARNIVRARTGNGPSTSTSRRSGNVASQLSTANKPTTSIVVAIKKCWMIIVTTSRTRPLAQGASGFATIANDDSTALTKTSNAANCPNNLYASPSPFAGSISRSNTRNRNWR